jgi:hypothetical protein
MYIYRRFESLLFITFWQLGEDTDVKKIAAAAAKLTKSGVFPTKGSKIINWLVTPGGKGVTISEADSEEAIFRSYVVWEKEVPGMFASYEVHPAVAIDKAVAITME